MSLALVARAKLLFRHRAVLVRVELLKPALSLRLGLGQRDLPILVGIGLLEIAIALAATRPWSDAFLFVSMRSKLDFAPAAWALRA